MADDHDENELADELRRMIRGADTPEHLKLGAIRQLRLIERGRPPLRAVPEPRGGAVSVPAGTPLAADGQPADPLAELDALDLDKTPANSR